MRQSGSRWLPVAVAIIAGCGLVLPVALGFLQSAFPAFGILAALNRNELSLDAWRKLVSLPGFETSVYTTVLTGFLSAALALAFSVGFYAALSGGRGFGIFRRFMSPLLAAPHAAVAIALAFLIAPSGWIFRLLSPWATGQTVPPNVIIVHDPHGLALVLGLALKETPLPSVHDCGCAQANTCRRVSGGWARSGLWAGGDMVAGHISAGLSADTACGLCRACVFPFCC